MIDIKAFLEGGREAAELASLVGDERVDLPGLGNCAHRVYLRRYDLIHPYVSGNKLFKLRGWLRYFEDNAHPLASFGGAYSNHLLALAYAGKVLQRETIGVIRGEEPANKNLYLKKMQELGMELHFVSREDYGKKTEPRFFNDFLRTPNRLAVIPEGGAGAAGVLGASDMLKKRESYDFVIVSGGTGTTAAGLVLAKSGSKIICNQVLKGKDYLRNEIVQMIERQGDVEVELPEVWDDYHLGGYAKGLAKSGEYSKSFELCNSIRIDAVYLAKTMMALEQAYLEGRFSGKERILVLHTGGLGVGQES